MGSINAIRFSLRSTQAVGVPARSLPPVRLNTFWSKPETW